MKISIVKKTNSQHPLYTDVVKNKKNKSPLDQEIDRQLKVQSIASSPSLEYNEHPHIFASSFKEQKSTNQLRRNYGKLSKSFLQKEKVNWDLQKVHEKNLRLALLGLAQGSYTFDRYRKKETKKFTEILLSGIKSSDKKWIEETKVLNESIHLCRDLINTPAEDMGPDQFEKATRSAIRGTGLKLKILRQKDCEKEKMGALLAVGKASHRETRMLVLEWPGSKKTTAKNKKFLALCGKGICFDTGGLNVKPGGSMLLMRKDMGGAATTLSTMIALARLKASSPIRAYIPLAENSLGPEAFRPGDILTASNGMTIEVGHTDAEGRLALADAIVKAKKDGAGQIVTVATLTGAAQVALGRIHVPIMGDKKLTQAIEKGASSSGEKVWTLPLDDDHKNLVRGQWADLTNSDGSGEAGCITAGAFLSYFAEGLPFAHCDISPASWKTAPHDLGPAGATGVLVTTLVDAFKEWKA